MPAKDAKQFVYRYNGVQGSEEVELDLDGEITVPQKDQVIARKGKDWKVVHVSTEESLSAKGPIPVVRVFLTDTL